MAGHALAMNMRGIGVGVTAAYTRAVQEELNMNEHQTTHDPVCRRCGSREGAAAADAKAIGLLDEFLSGTHTCCQVVQWADEQWDAWQQAAREDGKAPEEVTRRLEIEPDAALPLVRVRKSRAPSEKESRYQ